MSKSDNVLAAKEQSKRAAAVKSECQWVELASGYGRSTGSSDRKVALSDIVVFVDSSSRLDKKPPVSTCCC